MKFFFSRHPEWLLSVSPFLDGYLTVAAGFLIARVFLDCRRVFAFLDRQARNQFLAHVLCRTSRSLPCEPAAEISADEGLPTNTILALRRNRSFIETLSEGAFLLLRFLDVSDIAGDSRDVLLAGNFGKCDGQSQSAFSNHADLSGIPGGDVADVEIQPPTVGSWRIGVDICLNDYGVGRHCLRSFRPCVGNLFLALRRSVRDAVDVGLFVAESALSDHCTDNGGRDCFCSVAGCVGGSGRRVPVAFELLQYSKNICRGNNDYCSWDRSSNSLQGTYQVLSTTPFVCLQPNLQSVFFRGDTRQSEPFSPASILTSWKIHVTFVVSFPLSIWRYSHSKILVIRCSPHSNYI